MKKFSFSNFLVLLTLIVYGYLLYALPLHHASFYFDDRAAIVNNEAIKTIDMPKIFDAFNSRFLVGLSFAINYHFCHLEPFGYRLINLLIHTFNSFLVFLLVKTILKKSIWPAFFTSLFFLCHPLQTEAVNSITQRFVLMGTFFYLLTLYLYIQYRIRSQIIYLISAMFTAIAAMFCKEFVITLPFMLGLYDFYILDESPKNLKKIGKRLIPFLIIALIVPLVLLKTSTSTIGVANIAENTTHHQLDITRAKRSISRREYFQTELNVLCTYIRLLFIPINQNFDYDYPLSLHLDFKTIFSGLLLISLLITAFFTYKSYRIISFCIWWFFIALSVESSFIPIGHVIAEYRTYLASFAFVLFLIYFIYTRPFKPRTLHLLTIGLIIGFSFLTIQRNNVWKNEFSLWDDTIQKSPFKSRVYLNRGLEYFGQGKLDQALADFDKAIKLKSNSAAAYNDRGVIEALKGKNEAALNDFDKALAINPQYSDAFNNRNRLINTRISR